MNEPCMAGGLTDELLVVFAEEVARRAVSDYRSAYRRLQRHPDDEKARETVEEIRAFFRSSWLTCMVHPDDTLKRLDAALQTNGRKKNNYLTPHRKVDRARL